MIFIILYIASALIVGAVHWAEYQDKKKQGYEVSMEDRVVKLYVVPLVPVFNSLLVLKILANYIGIV